MTFASFRIDVIHTLCSKQVGCVLDAELPTSDVSQDS